MSSKTPTPDLPEPEEESISSFENFLIKWIDTGNLDTYMGVAKRFPGIVSFGVQVAGHKAPPDIRTLEYIFNSSLTPITRNNIITYCEFKDVLLDYMLYIFNYYGHTFEEDGINIFEKYCKNSDKYEGKITKKEYDNIDEKFKITAVRIRKIYKIITKYIIGFYDLSDHSIRQTLLADKSHFGRREKIKTRHRMIFILGELYETPSSWVSFIGLEDEKDKIGHTQEYGGGKYTRTKRKRKHITQKKRPTKLSAL